MAGLAVGRAGGQQDWLARWTQATHRWLGASVPLQRQGALAQLTTIVLIANYTNSKLDGWTFGSACLPAPSASPRCCSSPPWPGPRGSSCSARPVTGDGTRRGAGSAQPTAPPGWPPEGAPCLPPAEAMAEGLPEILPTDTQVDVSRGAWGTGLQTCQQEVAQHLFRRACLDNPGAPTFSTKK